MYEENQIYTKFLTCINTYGDSNNRILELQDEDGVLLNWHTKDTSNAYVDFRLKEKYNFKYKFKVHYIIGNSINIMSLKSVSKTNIKNNFVVSVQYVTDDKVLTKDFKVIAKDKKHACSTFMYDIDEEFKKKIISYYVRTRRNSGGMYNQKSNGGDV